jgi:hypothetical protein
MKLKADSAKISLSAAWSHIKSVAQAAYIRLVSEVGIFIIWLKKEDRASFTDHTSIDVAKMFRDTFAVVDKYSANFGKVCQDSTGVGDRIDTKAVCKGQADHVGVNDLATVSLQKAGVDFAGVTDQAATYLVKYLHETVTFTDDLDGSASILDDQKIIFFKVLGDVYALFDKTALDVGKSISEGASVFDASMAFLDKRVADVAGVSDSKALSLAKQANDAAGFSDVKQVQVGKGAQDAAGVGDSGSLRMQGYCEFSYFAEDYVGESRTF